MKHQVISTNWIDCEVKKQVKRERKENAMRDKAFKSRTCKPASHTKSGFGKVSMNRKG